MFEELNNKIEEIKNCKNNEIDKQFKKSQKGLIEMKKNIDNIIFCRIHKEVKKNDEIILKTNLEKSNELAMMRTLTELNIIPLSYQNGNKDKGILENYTPQENPYLYFLLSKTKAKYINAQTEPIQFWKTFLKFKGLEEYNKNK